MLDLSERLSRFTPITCRTLARRLLPSGAVVALTNAEIAAGSGLSVPDVARISRLRSWDNVSVNEMISFTKGCGIDLFNRDNVKRHMAIIRRTRDIPRYLRSAPNWESELKPLLLLSQKSSHAEN